MRIVALHVRNFRSYRSGWFFPNESINIMVGPNNSGKSTLFKALALLLDPSVPWHKDDIIGRFDFYQCGTDDEMTLKIWLKPDEHDSSEVVTKFYDKMTPWSIDETKDGKPCGMSSILLDPLDNNLSHDEYLAISLTAFWNEENESAEIECFIQDSDGEQICPFTKSMKSLLNFYLFSTRRNPLQELSFNKRSLLSKFFNEETLNSALKNLLGVLEESKQNLLQTDGIREVLEQFSGLIAPNLLYGYSGHGNPKFTLTFLNSEPWRLRSATSFAMEAASSVENSLANTLLPLDYQGDGFQNLLLLSAIISSIKGNETGIVAIEEPEQNLEPSWARWTFSQLCATSATNSSQVFITTHSPALLCEIDGADSLVMLPAMIESDPIIVSAKYLDVSKRKSVERERERYSPALLSRRTLIVEGPSELGFLPVAFRHLAESPSQDPFHLGLEIIDGSSRDSLIKHAKVIKAFDRPCHILYDHDVDDKGVSSTANLAAEAIKEGIVPHCWCSHDLVQFTRGCDLEVLLVKYCPTEVLYEAIKTVYEDPGHALDKNHWIEALRELDSAVKSKMPMTFPNLDQFELDYFSEENDRRAFLFALLHGPHSCKSSRDMRIIAKYLADNNAIPSPIDRLREQLVASMKLSVEGTIDAQFII